MLFAPIRTLYEGSIPPTLTSRPSPIPELAAAPFAPRQWFFIAMAIDFAVFRRRNNFHPTKILGNWSRLLSSATARIAFIFIRIHYLAASQYGPLWVVCV